MIRPEPSPLLPKHWRTPSGAPITCEEKTKILNDNILEIEAMVKEALEDAILMGCDAGQVREVLQLMMDTLDICVVHG